MERRIHTLGELEEEAVTVINTLIPQKEATLITLSGELGAGKTAFTKAVAKVLGVEEVVTSPTFVLEKLYQLNGRTTFKKLVHIDAYRLEKGTELSALGFDALMQDPQNLILLEWPEKVAEALPTPAVRITITTGKDDARMISYG